MKTVLITGGSRGIGAAMVRIFTGAGYNVAFSYLKSESQARDLAEATGALAVKADSGSESDIIKCVGLVKDRFGGIDILINNAAVSSFGLIQDITSQEWDETFNVTMRGAFLYTKAVLNSMLAGKWGRIINITSMWGVVGSACEVHYSAAKAGLIGFTKALAKELGPSGITVNAIAPGVVDTDMNKALTKEDISALCDETPVGRMGNAHEIARAALFLASSDSGFITGDVMNISGGYIT